MRDHQTRVARHVEEEMTLRGSWADPSVTHVHATPAQIDMKFPTPNDGTVEPSVSGGFLE